VKWLQIEKGVTLN